MGHLPKGLFIYDVITEGGLRITKLIPFLKKKMEKLKLDDVI